MSYRKYSDGSSSSSSSSSPRDNARPGAIPSKVLRKLLDFRPTSTQLSTRQTWHLPPQWTWDSRGGPRGQVHTSATDFQDAGGREYVDMAFPGKQKVLGKGAYGEVMRVSCNGRYLARKRTSIDPKDEEWMNSMDEINILKQLSHQHIAQLCGVYVLGQELYSLSYPVAEKDLYSFLQEGKIYDPTWVQSLIGGLGCLSRALAYAHAAGIKHRDIHAGNVLVIGGTMILCDWGLSRLASAPSGPAYIRVLTFFLVPRMAPLVAAQDTMLELKTFVDWDVSLKIWFWLRRQTGIK